MHENDTLLGAKKTGDDRSAKFQVKTRERERERERERKTGREREMNVSQRRRE
jgi:hypothetical protein